MIIITIQQLAGREGEHIVDYTCPECGISAAVRFMEMFPYDWAVKNCGYCRTKLVNVKPLIKFKDSRIAYHRGSIIT